MKTNSLKQEDFNCKYNYSYNDEMSLFIADYICNKSNYSISNLRLQKLLYIVSLFYLGSSIKTIKPLFKEEFQAWSYGPVLKTIYDKAKIFGNRHVQPHIFYNIANLKIKAEIITLIDDIVISFSNCTDARLVNLTHREGSAWYKNYNSNAFGVNIPYKDVLIEYNSLVKSNEKEE